jgi:two-component system OmpR family response regulator
MENRMAHRILVVDDDPHIRDVISFALEKAGMTTETARDGREALTSFRRRAPDMIILDIGMPDTDGLDVCREIRKSSDVPILFLSARDDEIDRVIGLEIGADDYVTKPFSTAELMARVRALLRRATGTVRERVLDLGPIHIDPARRVVERHGEPVTLTTLEFDLLYFLASRPGRVFTREALMEQVWGSDRVVDDRSIDSLVSRLRRKLEDDPGTPRFIQTVWGAGYRFAEPT